MLDPTFPRPQSSLVDGEFKPPSLVYVDDRAIRFRGDWEQTILDIQQFRK